MYPSTERIMSSLKVIAFLFIILSVSSSCKKEEERIMAVRNDSISDISSTSARVHATIIDIGNGIEQHGHCWSTDEEPTLDDNEGLTENGHVSDPGSFISIMENLMPDTKYYTRAYIRKSSNIVYSNALSFSTLQVSLPVVTTGSVGDLTISSATVTGNLNSLGDGASSVAQHGHCWSSETSTPTIDVNDKSSLGSRDSTGSFQSLLVGLSPNVLYYVRAYATNSAGTAYGSYISFTTPQETKLPVLTTTLASSITAISAWSGGNITDDGGSAVTARGVCWSTSEYPTVSDSHTNDGSGTGSFTSNITGLSPNTGYYVRAYATNSAGTSYGDHVSFKTMWDNSEISDYDGNTYATVQIGEQIWMAENLKTTRYSNGTPLVDGTGVTDISGDYTTKYWFVHGDNPDNKNVYGLLYTWAAVMNGASSSDINPSEVQGVCPAGWHVPSDKEWKQLEIYLGMNKSEADNEGWRGTDEGGKLKEIGTAHWSSPNTGATNASGFTALAGGHRTNANTYVNMGTGACFWSTTASDSQGWTRLLFYNNAEIYRNDYAKNFGHAVRCIKD